MGGCGQGGHILVQHAAAERRPARAGQVRPDSPFCTADDGAILWNAYHAAPFGSLVCRVLASVGPRLEALSAFLDGELRRGTTMEAAAAAACLTNRLSLLYLSCWSIARTVQLSRTQTRQLGRGTLLLTDAGLEIVMQLVGSGCQGSAAHQLTHSAKELACGLLNALAWAINCTMLADSRDTVFQDCAALSDAPPEQALRFLAEITQLVGFGEWAALTTIALRQYHRERQPSLHVR